jgi:formylglycine-generating enzyme required for sulfatase activity
MKNHPLRILLGRFYARKPQPIPEGFIHIQGGTFTRGSSDVLKGGDEVRHQVTVSGFYMGQYAVTQREYVAVMGKNPVNFTGDKLPVEKVSWFDAIQYCNARSQIEGLTPAYRISGKKVAWRRMAKGYRLPTEAEWEYACRAGTTTTFNTGNHLTTEQANYNGTRRYLGEGTGIYRETATDVGSFAPNPWGIYDMHGNVWEWCWDWYGKYSMANQTNPKGAAKGQLRTMRGGGWGNGGGDLRSACRGWGNPSARALNLGFRLVSPLV